MIKDGITLTGSGGSGRGLISLTGSNSLLYADGSETLDNMVINIGNINEADVIYNVSDVAFLVDDAHSSLAILTLGPESDDQSHRAECRAVASRRR